MAEHRIAAHLLLRYDTYVNWINSSTILKAGEAAVAIFPSQNTLIRTDGQPANTPPAIGLKIGDGQSYFVELPWVQAVAADVYSWAKSSTKPTYEASEIIGLRNYIEQYSGGGSGGGSGGTNTNSGIYRISYNENTYKYILQYYDTEQEDWVNTDSEIDFNAIYQRLNQLENWANGEVSNIGNIYPLILTIREEYVTQLGKLSYQDNNATPGKFVTSVTQNNGKITVFRAGIKANDIEEGVFNVAQGGTGATTFPAGEVLIGNGINKITTKEIVNTIQEEDKNSLASTGAIMKYVNEKTAGLTGAMHFVGESTVQITSNSNVNPQIPDYNFALAKPGDVILANNAQEFVWTGSTWRLLGDEGSYAVKGSIVDADISAEANISQSKISNLTDNLNSKVDKIEGKGLSTNDYTNEDKSKLEGIEVNAQANVIEHIFINDVERVPTVVNSLDKSINLQIYTFDDEYREKLESIARGAQVNEIEHIFVNNVEMPIGIINNKIKSVGINFLEYTQSEKDKLAAIESGAQVNTIEHIFVNNEELQPVTINDRDKSISIVIDAEALNLNVLVGATVPNGNSTESVDISNKNLLLARVAKTGDVKDLLQTSDTYIILDCGSSTTVI